MDIFAQNKLLTRGIIIVVLLNMSIIGIFLWKEFHHGPLLFPDNKDYHDVAGILKRELDLTEQQAEQFKSIRADFFEKEKSLTQTIRNERDSMNMLMYNAKTDTAMVRSLAKEVSENEYQMELLRIAQAQQLKSVCTPEQLNKFERLVKEIRDYVRPDNQPRKH